MPPSPQHESPAPDLGDVSPGDWQPLPARARALMALTGALQWALPGVGLSVVLGGPLAGEIGLAPGWSARLLVATLLVAVAATWGGWLGLRRHRHTQWRHGPQGLALRRGRLWYRETRVPASRVQHLDVTRGPLQRGRDLATLVVHTAGTQHSAVKFPNLDATDAERLRDALGRQIDHDDDT